MGQRTPVQARPVARPLRVVVESGDGVGAVVVPPPLSIEQRLDWLEATVDVLRETLDLLLPDLRAVAQSSSEASSSLVVAIESAFETFSEAVDRG